MATRQPLSFADLLRRHRNAVGLSQEELAVRAGLSRRGISDIERGLKRPYKDTVERLVNALGLTGSERALFESAARGQQSSGARSSGGPVAPGANMPHEGSFASELTTLVDRTRELSLISRHLHTHMSHSSPLLLLAGEPGIGKTRLLQEATARAHEAGWAVLAGGCVRRGGQEPFEPFVSILARAVATTPPAQQRRDLAGCGWLARLLLELIDIVPVPAPTWELHPEQERRLMFASIRRYLANIAGRWDTARR
jgi:transcriptional regulator with XRE-family HTH domain